MKSSEKPYCMVALPAGRRAWLNTLDLGGPAHFMYGLLEVDVTVPRQFIADYQERTGEALSFTGFLVHCLARAVDENREVQAYLKGRRQVIHFADVDVGMLVEHSDGEKKALMGHVIRAAQRKSCREIHDEIRRVQSEPAPANRGMPAGLRSILLLPRPVCRLLFKLMAALPGFDPEFRISASGTVFITAVGMFGKGHSGWGLTTTPHSLSLVVGSISWKPAIVAGRIEPREVLNLTVLFDHDIIDGAPAARFTKRLIELIESGWGLEEEPVAVVGEPSRMEEAEKVPA